jgi:hypothetical protein
VTIGDMTSTRVPGTFRLVYLVANTIMNVTTQDDQLAVFANAAAHLELGGRFAMAKITGFRVRDRWAGWDRAPFTSGSHSQLAVFEKLFICSDLRRS